MVDLTGADGIAWLTLNRPQALNALNSEMVRQFAAHVAELRERADVRVVITKGEGRAFCAGSDLHEVASLSRPGAAAAELMRANAFALLDTLPQPTVAMLHGYVLGGGLGVALYHDFRIASASAVLGMPEVELGWTPRWAVGRMVDVVGGTHARWLLLTCSRITAAEAKTLGLINKIMPDENLVGQVEVLARKLCAAPPAGVRRTKALINQMSPWRDSPWDVAAADAFRLCYETEDARQRVADFVSRRRT